MKRLVSTLTMIATALFFGALILTFLYPEALRSINLNLVEARTILMELISFILVLSFMQTHLTLPWRIFSLISSFIVLIESILMLGAWQQLFK